MHSITAVVSIVCHCQVSRCFKIRPALYRRASRKWVRTVYNTLFHTNLSMAIFCLQGKDLSHV